MPSRRHDRHPDRGTTHEQLSALDSSKLKKQIQKTNGAWQYQVEALLLGASWTPAAPALQAKTLKKNRAETALSEQLATTLTCPAAKMAPSLW